MACCSVAIGRLIPHHHVVALFTDQHLTHRVTAHSGLNGVLDIRDIDSKTGSLAAVDGQIEIGLAEIAQEFYVMHSRDTRHESGDFFAFFLENLQVIPENLQCQRTLGARHCFSDVVFDRLRKVPDCPWIFFQCAVHGGDQFLLAADGRLVATRPWASGRQNIQCSRIRRCQFRHRDGRPGTQLF